MQNGRILVEGGSLSGPRTANPGILVSGVNNSQGFSSRCHRRREQQNADSQKERTLTVTVRSGATFATGAGGAQVATVNGVTDTIRGSLDPPSLFGREKEVDR